MNIEISENQNTIKIKNEEYQFFEKESRDCEGCAFSKNRDIDCYPYPCTSYTRRDGKNGVFSNKKTMNKKELEMLIYTAIAVYIQDNPETSIFEVYLTKKSDLENKIVEINVNILTK